jgi:hypothetical protein
MVRDSLLAMIRLSYQLEALGLPYLPLFHLLSYNRGVGQEVAHTRALVSGRGILGKLGRRNIAAEIVDYVRSSLDAKTTLLTSSDSHES